MAIITQKEIDEAKSHGVSEYEYRKGCDWLDQQITKEVSVWTERGLDVNKIITRIKTNGA